MPTDSPDTAIVKRKLKENYVRRDVRVHITIKDVGIICRLIMDLGSVRRCFNNELTTHCIYIICFEIIFMRL